MDQNQNFDINKKENDGGYNTLDEPQRISLNRDVNSIIEKEKIVILPMKIRNSKIL